MIDRRAVSGAVVLVLAWCGTAAAQAPEPWVLTLDAALSRARERAPAVIEARARVPIARGAVVEARPWQPYDPEIEVAGGARLLDDRTALEFEGSIGQRFELGGQRGARVAAAEARVAAASAEADDAVRRALAETAAAFHRAAYAEQRLAVLREASELAAALRDVAERRHAAGDVGVLDVHVGRLGAARADAQVLSAEAERRAAIGDLRALLAIEAGREIRVRIEERTSVPSLEALLRAARRRADLRALEAEARAGAAEVELGDAMGWPDLGLFARYAREEDAHVVMGGLSLTLPLYGRGDGARATGIARRDAAQAVRAARIVALEAALRADHEAWQTARAAAARFEDAALRSLEESLSAARRAYEAGGVALAELLAFSREMIDARLVQVELSLEAALLGVALEARAGLLGGSR